MRSSSSLLVLALLTSLGACASDDSESVASNGGAGAGPAAVSGGVPAAGAGGAPVAGTGSAGRAGTGAAGSGRAGAAASGTGAAGSSGPIQAGRGASAGAGAGQGGTPAANGGAGAAAPGGAADFHDSFDGDAQLDPARYELASKDCSGTGMIVLDGAVGHLAAPALRVDGGAGYCNHVFVRLATLPMPLPDSLHVRVFVKVAMPLGAGHTTFAAMHDSKEDKDLRLGGQNMIMIWNRESDDATLPELSPTGTALSKPLMADQWHCLEWSLAASSRELHTYLDGVEVAGLVLDGVPTPDVDTQWMRKADWAPTPIDVRLGWESYGDQANTLWFDDLAVGRSRLGCEPASGRSP